MYPHRLVQALVNDIQSYLYKRQALWVGDVMERELTDTSDHPHSSATSCNHSVSYWQCKRCQHGKVGGEHTLKPGGCRYAPGGDFEHQLPKLRSKEKKDEEKAKLKSNTSVREPGPSAKDSDAQDPFQNATGSSIQGDRSIRA